MPSCLGAPRRPRRASPSRQKDEGARRSGASCNNALWSCGGDGTAPVVRWIGNMFSPPPLFLHEPGRFQGTQADPSRLDGCRQTLAFERVKPQTTHRQSVTETRSNGFDSRRLTHRLSAAFVRTASPDFYCDGHGLNLRVDPSGARRWGAHNGCQSTSSTACPLSMASERKPSEPTPSTTFDNISCLFPRHHSQTGKPSGSAANGSLSVPEAIPAAQQLNYCALNVVRVGSVQSSCPPMGDSVPIVVKLVDCLLTRDDFPRCELTHPN